MDSASKPAMCEAEWVRNDNLLIEADGLLSGASFSGVFYEAGDERPDADGAENEARSAHDSIDGDSPASDTRPSGKNRAGA